MDRLGTAWREEWAVQEDGALQESEEEDSDEEGLGKEVEDLLEDSRLFEDGETKPYAQPTYD